ncbi:hypothetical protein HRR83_004774 [Exophiala dermatitidis]|uniref:Hydroxylacyl-CoA dehydrogenase n=1 Tax=Exophiala dermatitidis TaxID=5970 RepID=A0AAN6EYU8_EXODE|nr:hypothetical protein HRR75_003616 [Exophiala dermatitidis]KAJ4519204.1 hypothetical protein HRR74_003945 [Exophiala dermatitidis]KAJ4529020.1 hypothetical protein HRR73_000040 [Exophiala dermatitidis]KAJ4538416.1 hypothetical protein HRR77_006901 [Exophiala dermatitidis]KAJ4544337.1 hypothetical protein HRR76_002401 [Exophiala dermatitidis]
MSGEENAKASDAAAALPSSASASAPVRAAQSPAASRPHANEHIALIGLGAIGVSFLALHLTYSSATVSVYDPRPDLEDHIRTVLPLYLHDDHFAETEDDAEGDIDIDIVSRLLDSQRLKLATSLEAACRDATIVQEQGPENLSFKQKTWAEVVRYVSLSCHLWSSTSGIPASKQLEGLEYSESSGTTDESVDSARQRLLVVHPFNPPHIMPLLELVPSPSTSPDEVTFAKSYFQSLNSGHRPITIHKESAGFVANRLSFILFREACHLVNQGVASPEEIDEIVRASLGPRWAVAGPFKMYNFGGGNRGMKGFLENIGESIGEVWNDAGLLSMHGHDSDEWKEKVVQETTRAYGLPKAQDVRERDRGLKAVVGVQEELQRDTT